MLSSIKSISVCLVLILVLTIFIPPTAFCDTKSEASTTGTTGVLSIGPDGNIYIQFTVSHIKLTAGKFIMEAIAETELTQTQADQHEFQIAVYKAYNDWLKCEEAKKKAANGKITLVQMEFECTKSKLSAAQESFIGTMEILNNNLGKDIEWVKPTHEDSKLDIEDLEQEIQSLIDLGAEPTAEGYEPPDFITFNTSDPIINTDLILDTLPVRDQGAATRFAP